MTSFIYYANKAEETSLRDACNQKIIYIQTHRPARPNMSGRKIEPEIFCNTSLITFPL